MASKSLVAPALLLIAASCVAASAARAQTYKVSGSIPIGGTGGWDYLAVDATNRRLYVSHGPNVAVVDLESQKSVGTLSGFKGVHGIAVAPEFGVGFISDGGANEVVAFDLKSRSIKDKIPVGRNPDGIVYDPASKRVFAFNGRDATATAIDAETRKPVGSVSLPGKPEFSVSNGAGDVFVNIEDKNEIDRIDPRNLTVTAHWPLAPCESPSGLAIDAPHKRLFAVCDNKMMVAVDAASGKVLAVPAIGDHPDAAAYDPGTNLAFSSNGDGTLTVVRESGGRFTVAETVPTAAGARTMALDPRTHRIYLSVATLGPTPAPTTDRPHPRPVIVPDTFKVLIVAK